MVKRRYLFLFASFAVRLCAVASDLTRLFNVSTLLLALGVKFLSEFSVSDLSKDNVCRYDYKYIYRIPAYVGV